MNRSTQRGFTMGEVLLVTSLLSFASTGVMTLLHKKAGRSSGEQYYKQMVMDGRGTVDQIAAELRLAGLPRNEGDTALTFTNSNQVAASTFLLASGDQIVFEADVDNDGAVERVEYRLKGENLERSAVTKRTDGSVPQSTYEIVAERVDNGGLPVFTFDGDLTGDLPVSPDPQQVRVMLLLRSPVRDRKAGRARTVGFEAVAQRSVASPGAEPPSRIEASTPETTDEVPGDVAATSPAESPAGEPIAENSANGAAESSARNSPDPRQNPLHQLLDLPVIYPADAAKPEATDDSAAVANAEQLRAGLVIATTANSDETANSDSL